MQEGLIDNRDMPEGRRIKDLVEVIERRKKEIVERKPSQKKSEAEKLNKIGKEAVFFQKQLAERDIVLEEDGWTNKVLEIIDEKKALEEKVKQAEEILGLQLKNLEESSPPLTNLSETVNLLPKIGINLKKDENGRNYYDTESLSNKLTELIRKEEENNSLRETIKTKGEEIEKLKNDLDVEKVAAWEKGNKELTNSLSNARKEVNGLQIIIAENANRANKEKQEDLEEIARNLGIEEREVKDKPVEEIQKIIKEKAEQLQRVKNKVEELPNLINKDGENETLTSLLNRPKSKEKLDQIDELQKRPTQADYDQAANKLKDTAKKLSEAEKALSDEQTEHEKTKTALTAANQDKEEANQIIDEAKEALGVEDLEDDLLDKLNGSSLPEIIEQRDKANTAKLEAEAQRDKANQTGTTNPEEAKTKIERLDQAAREANAAQAKVEAEKTAATAKTRLDQAEKNRDTYLEELNKARDKSKNLIDSKVLEQKIKEMQTKYEGFINPKNITLARQQAGLKTEDEVNAELDKIAHQLGLGNHNDLTDSNLANLQAAEKERDNARRSLRTDNLNTLLPIPAGETLQTLLDRPTQQQLVEAVNQARQQEAEKYTNHIDPHNLEAEAEKAGFGFTQQDIDEAEYKKTEAALTNANNTIVTAQKQLENLQNQPTLEQYNSRPNVTVEDYNHLLNNQKPGDYDDIKNELERPDIPITKQDWENDYRQRPTPEQLTQAVQKEKDKYSTHISPEKLTTDYVAKDKLEEEAKKQGMVSKEDYDKIVREKNARPDITKADWNNDYSKRPKQTDLDQANKKIQDYENDLKIRLKNRPTSDNSGEIKAILGLGSTDNLPNDWQNQLVKKDDLKAFLNKTPEKAAQELADMEKELKSKTADTTLIAKKQQKIDELIKLIEVGHRWNDRVRQLKKRNCSLTERLKNNQETQKSTFTINKHMNVNTYINEANFPKDTTTEITNDLLRTKAGLPPATKLKDLTRIKTTDDSDTGGSAPAEKLKEVTVGNNVDLEEVSLEYCPNLEIFSAPKNSKLDKVFGLDKLNKLKRAVIDEGLVRYIFPEKLNYLKDVVKNVREILGLGENDPLPLETYKDSAGKNRQRINKNGLKTGLQDAVVNDKSPQLKADKENAEKERDAAKAELESTKTECDQLKQQLEKIRKELGLGKDATEQQTLDKIKELMKRPSGPACTHTDYDDIKAERDRLKTENTKLKDKNKENADIDVITKKVLTEKTHELFSKLNISSANKSEISNAISTHEVEEVRSKILGSEFNRLKDENASSFYLNIGLGTLSIGSLLLLF
ncbi:5329_t:CDS:10 [Ambispora leptoticha]|uniref:5329_t:CDS:1 n=1 Tax=Ambispora leptoticha TaxID=144679 RepID=A0A9N9GUP1_9GLOM|nr:5329_t:CDS:10 [Ambispora leptoticha]